MKIAIIKYNAGNLFSVDCALKRLGVEPVITNDKETLLSADKVTRTQQIASQRSSSYREDSTTVMPRSFARDSILSRKITT